MASPKPKLLYFVSPVYARGEHIIGEKTKNSDGSPNMVRVDRGEKREIESEVAKDLLIAKQAIDLKASSSHEIAEAEAFVKERKSEEAREARRIEESKTLKKAA